MERGTDASIEGDLNLRRKCCPNAAPTLIKEHQQSNSEETAQPFSQLEIKSHKGKITEESRWETTNIYRTNIWGNTVIPPTHGILLQPIRLTELFWTRKNTEVLLCVCVCVCVCVCACSVVSNSLWPHRLTVARLPGPVHGMLQARILALAGISFSRGFSWTRDRICVSCPAGGFVTRWAGGKACVCVSDNSMLQKNSALKSSQYSVCEMSAAQSCVTPSDPMDCALPGSSVHGNFQARVLEWGEVAA